MSLSTIRRFSDMEKSIVLNRGFRTGVRSAGVMAGDIIDKAINEDNDLEDELVCYLEVDDGSE
eukprot:CAMPEP_0118639420 /NCGR_PEP_ID=MMETSP0785-20121206/4213_1 /TAXON_ID=91992 /ORGANISM="Bolidomonas pacifica, Strain CCMP 1866" /LENGTH=62 /DNA_ID=CAMNT_0006530745 /DNA_START=13 /DNA_END=199 /DNA_ORIENTATION=+